MNEKMLYLSMDGDGIGQKCGRAVLADDAEGLKAISAKIEAGQATIENWVQQNGGSKISGGGDEFTALISSDAVSDLETLRQDYNFATGATLTVGVGSTLSQSGKALMAGKFRGKDQVVQYEPIVEHELQEAHSRVAGGTGSEEEQKIDEAYLTPQATPEVTPTVTPEVDHDHTENCQYCQESMPEHNHTDDCKYCQMSESVQGHDHTDDCKYCQAAEAGTHDHTDDCVYCAAHNDKPENVHTDDCQYCAQMQKPDHEHSGDDCQYCAQMASPAQATPGQALSPSQTPSDGVSLDMGAQPQPPTLDPTAANAGPVLAGMVGQDDPSTQTERGTIDNVDPNETPVGTNVQGGASMPEDPNAPSDSQDAPPAMQDVLRGNLDQHADQIAKEKVVMLVGQALEGLKQNKEILERAKEQAKPLYDSVILALKAMIEMSRMLGLRAPQTQAPEQTLQDPQQGQPSGGGSPDPKVVTP